MTKQEVFEKTRDLIAEHLGIEDKTKILPDTNLSNEFGADSLDAVEIIMEIEKAFGVSIDWSFAQEVNSVSDITNRIEELLHI